MSVVLGGCSVYRTYKRPDVAVIDSLYRQQISPADSVASIADLSWKELFTDPHLQKLIETGLCNNSDLGIARLRAEEAEALLQSARLSYLPSISLSPQGTIGKVEHSKTTKSYDLATSASWEIDIFGKLTNTKREARVVLEQSEAYRQAVQTQLIATIANSYYTLLMLDEQLNISRRAQTEASKLSVDASLLSLERQITELENTLLSLLGSVPGDITRSTLSSQSFPDTLLVGVPLQLLQRRPDVRQSEAVLAAAFYVTNQARAAFFPSITLSGSAGWTNAAGVVITNPGQWLFSVVGSLIQPLFNRGQNIANLKVAKAQQEEALLSFRQSLLDAGTEVNNALVQWQTARGKLKLDEQQVVALTSAVRSAELLMKHSSQNYLEVLTARQALLQAELDAVSDRFDEIQGIINLYRSLGGGSE